jgi:hypothetical protein
VAAIKDDGLPKLSSLQACHEDAAAGSSIGEFLIEAGNLWQHNLHSLLKE